MQDDKRRHRELKRTIKEEGRRKLRLRLKRSLAEDPEGAVHDEVDYGRDTSVPFNGNDRDATRRRAAEEK
jgi:hypothetical protein